MKKFAYIVLCTSLLSTSLVGCGDNQSSPADQNTQNQTTAQSQNSTQTNQQLQMTNDEEVQQPFTSKTPAEVVNKFLTNLQHQKYTGNSATYKENLDNMADFKNQIETISPTVATALFDKLSSFTYTIDDVIFDENDDTKATVLVTMNYYDVGSRFDEALLSYIASNFEMTYDGSKEQEIIENAEKNILPLLEDAQQVSARSIPITLTREGDTWKINKMSDNPLLLNILTGNILNEIHQTVELEN